MPVNELKTQKLLIESSNNSHEIHILKKPPYPDSKIQTAKRIKKLAQVCFALIAIPFSISSLTTTMIPALGASIAIETIKYFNAKGKDDNLRLVNLVRNAFNRSLAISFAGTKLSIKTLAKIEILFLEKIKGQQIVNQLRSKKGHLKTRHYLESITRTDYDPKTRILIQRLGDREIEAIEVISTPVTPIVQKLLNLITFGEFKSGLDKNPFESNIYHTALIITLKGEEGKEGEKILCEKNEVIELKEIDLSKKEEKFKKNGTKSFAVQVKPNQTINKLLGKTKEKMGDKYFRYSPFKYNCQHFIKKILNSNDLNIYGESSPFQNLKPTKGHITKVHQDRMKFFVAIGRVANVMLKGR